jgi:hypothetical protein
MGFVKSMFKRPKAPANNTTIVQQEVTPTPTIDQASQNAEDEMRLRRRKGRQRYINTQGQQNIATPTVGTKTLVGQ